MKILAIIETAYRATIEEQDDPILWLSAVVKGAGAPLDLLLRGNAVSYAVKDQDASGLAFGAWRQTQPPRLAADVAGLAAKGVAVFVAAEDLAERGLGRGDLVAGVEPVTPDAIAGLIRSHDQIWHW